MRAHASMQRVSTLATLVLTCTIPWIAACSAASLVDPAKNDSTVVTPSPPPPPPLRIDSLSVSAPDRVGLGAVFKLRAFFVRSDGTRLEATEAQWFTPTIAVLSINTATGIATAIGVGSAIVNVRAQGLAVSASITVVATHIAAAGTLTINQFSVIEYGDDQKYYAPQLIVTAAPANSVTVLALDFHIPGLEDPIPTIACTGHLAAGATRQLNGEVYGDWAFAFYGTGRQATGDSATAVVTFIDDAGAGGSITARGPVVPGTLPDTYGGDAGACADGWAMKADLRVPNE